MAPLNRLFTLLISISLLSLAACETEQAADEIDADTTAMEDMAPDAAPAAYAQLAPTAGNEVRGTVRFEETAGGVRIVASATGLEEGQHGFHVHENGDCGQNAEAAGGHFNPTGAPHGAPTDPADQRHVGDLGNLEVDASGNASYERVDNVITLSGANSVIGKAVIIHSGTDDMETQPTGDAGSRLACGVIMSGSGAGGMMPGDTTGMMPGDTTGGM